MRTPETTRPNRRASLPAKTLLLAALAFAALAIGWSAAAFADEYTVNICTPTARASDGLFGPTEVGAGNPGQFFLLSVCSNPSREDINEQSFGKVTKDSGVRWELRAPAGAQIETLELDQSVIQPILASFLDWDLVTSTGNTLFHIRDDHVKPVEPLHKSYSVNAARVTGTMHCAPGAVFSCPEPQGPTPGSLQVQLKNIVAHLEDFSPPSVDKPELANTVHGTVEVPVSAADFGSGLNEVTLIVDGVVLAHEDDGNEGKCVPPYGFVTPCKLKMTTSFSLDTSKLAEGPHQMELMARDASGKATFSSPATDFVVHNAPTNTDRPRITGTTMVGARLVANPGGWEGSPALSFQWLRCPATTSRVDDETGCVPIPGATGPEYVQTEAETAQRAIVKVTAKNAAGVASALSAPTDPITPVPSPPPPNRDRTAPLLKKVVLSHKRLRFGAGAKAGATSLLFSSNEGGKLTIVLERPRRGRKPRHVRSLAATIKPGRIAVPLGPSFASMRLAPGAYRLTITVRDAAGNLSKPARALFRVLPS